MDTAQRDTTGCLPVRVRDQVRDALAVMAFSAGASALLAAGLVLVGTLGG